jgi:hypothetical protein
MTSRMDLPARRRFLTTAGAGIAALIGVPGRVDSSPAIAANQPQVRLVKEFLLSWSSGMKSVLSYLAEDCEYRFTQWGPNRTGHARLAEDLSINVDRPRSVVTKIFDCSSAGPVVMAHYEHRYVYDEGDLTWEGAATFYIRDNKIKEWRTYTIRVGDHVMRA